MRIAWYSTSPNATSGYGTQTKQMLTRLRADGHEVAVLGLWGNQTGLAVFDTPDGPIPIFPAGAMHYGLDVIDDQCKFWFRGQPGWVISLYDVWVLGNRLKDQRVASWTPIDHYPVTPSVLKWAETHPTIAMSKFGQRALAEAGVEAPYIPHGLERDWRPTESDVRSRMSVPDDAFLVMINAANIGSPKLHRKAWDQNLHALALFAKRHDDVLLYLHTDPTRADGFPIPRYLGRLGLPENRLRITDMFAYRSGLIGMDEMARLYSAADVLLLASMGEGFGLPVAESMACGTPAIVSNFSAQPEIVGDTGWLVDGEPYFDELQDSWLVIPSIAGILEALEEAYEERGTKAAERSAAAEQRARAEYDADTVYAEKWRPYLAGLEAQLAPPPALNREARRAQRRNLVAVK